MGLLQKFQIALDAASRSKFEQDMSSAGKEGGAKLEQGMGTANPMKNVNLEATKTKGIFSGLSGVFTGVGAAIGAAFAVHKIVDFGKASIDAANESDEVWNAFGLTLKNNGTNLDAQRERFEALGQKFLETTKYGDEAAIASANSYIQITGDVAGATNAVSVAADLASARQISLETATNLVAKAENGHTTALQKLGIEIPKGSDAVAVLAARFKGAAENELNTFGGKTAQLGQYMGELKESIGHAMIAAGEGSSIMDTFTGMIKGAAEWVEKNKDQLTFLGGVLLGAVSAGFKAVGFLVVSFATGLGKMWDIGKVAFEGILTGFQKLMEFGAKVASALGMDVMAQEMRNAAGTAKGILDDLEKKNKASTEAIKTTHTQMGANLGEALEGGGTRGTVAMQKLAAEAAKVRAKFEEEVKQASYNMPKLAEEALKQFSDITQQTIDGIARASSASQAQQLADIKATLKAETEAFTEAQTQIVVTQGMTTEQRRAEFERAAAAQEGIEAQTVVDGLQRNDEYMKSQEYRDQQRVEAMTANANELAGNQVTAAEGAATDINAAEGRVTKAQTTEIDARIANIGTFSNKIGDAVTAIQGLGTTFGIEGGSIGKVLGGITGGVGSVIGALNNAGTAATSLSKQFSFLGSGISDVIGKLGAFAGIGGSIGALTGGGSAGGNIGGSLGGVLGGAIGGPVGAAIGGAIGGVIGGAIHENKDPGRLNANQVWYQRALRGDAAALESLKTRSGRHGTGGAENTLGGSLDPNQGGWATDLAKNDAEAKYQAALAALGGGGGGTSATAVRTATANPTRTTATVTSSTQNARTSSGGGVTINQYGVQGDNATGKTLAAIDEGMAKKYQRGAALSGNSSM